MTRLGLTRSRLLTATVLLVVAATLTPAAAHHRTGGPTTGIAIPSLSHGQMAVLDANRAAILALAERQPQRDERFSRILNYARIQYAICLWGLMPGAIDNDDSPFNECAHAYLAATRALLSAMSETAPPAAEAHTLAAKVDRELLLNGTLELCSFSGETFNTADVVQPHWTDVPGHLPSLAVLGSVALAAIGGVALAARPGRRRRG
ncbi:hypothetical protein HNR60_002634 [Rhodopseudomonas rhenobacensis]|uniref:Uncharacterized protein n=1 Tax=Rhodopseudomonas rhenobacensis TaxID=87461 RepID=A0A7W7Z5G6_9BRAD|nr:hypothetical protein [Rhodopseudomonas rhenobacensis]MBB5047877.1 hypothetical protein [Rhodopseudomonas rhenobacensis]